MTRHRGLSLYEDARIIPQLASPPSGERFMLRRKPKLPEVKAKLVSTMHAANVYANRLQAIISRLDAKLQEVKRKAEEARKIGWEERAKIYEREAVQLEGLIKKLSMIQACIEAIALRIETIVQVGAAYEALLPAAKVLDTLRRESIAAMPEVGMALEDLWSSVNKVLAELSPVMAPSAIVSSSRIDEEAKRILDEAQAVAEAKLSSALLRP